jgi:hypothetical protein
MPVVEGLSFGYALHELPPGRVPFRRWRWELWHGSRLEAAGWRLTRRDAERALHARAARVGHAMFGLRPPSPDVVAHAPALLPGLATRVELGTIAFSLVPVRLETPAPAHA